MCKAEKNRFYDPRKLFRRKLQDLGAHFLAGFEFDHGASRNGHVGFRLVGIAPDACLADFDFKDSEIAQFHLVALGQGLGDVIKGFLHHIKNLLLAEVGFIADADD